MHSTWPNFFSLFFFALGKVFRRDFFVVPNMILSSSSRVLQDVPNSTTVLSHMLCPKLSFFHMYGIPSLNKNFYLKIIQKLSTFNICWVWHSSRSLSMFCVTLAFDPQSCQLQSNSQTTICSLIMVNNMWPTSPKGLIAKCRVKP
jgi:hypothetical protein